MNRQMFSCHFKQTASCDTSTHTLTFGRTQQLQRSTLIFLFSDGKLTQRTLYGPEYFVSGKSISNAKSTFEKDTLSRQFLLKGEGQSLRTAVPNSAGMELTL